MQVIIIAVFFLELLASLIETVLKITPVYLLVSSTAPYLVFLGPFGASGTYRW